MKKIRTVLALLSILVCTCLSAQDNTLRASYKYDGLVHISTEPEYVSVPGHPFRLKMESVVFPDKSSAYLLYLEFEDSEYRSIPKGVKIGVSLPGGKVVRGEQVGNGGERRSFETPRGRVYRNTAKYIFEVQDMDKMLSGVTGLDVVTGFGPDDYFQLNFHGDEFTEVISRHIGAIRNAPLPPDEVSVDDISGYSDNSGSITVLTRPIVARAEKYIYNVALNYLYYKNTDKEDFDLNFMIGTEDSHEIPLGSEIVFGLKDGSEIVLRQEREQVNTVYCYPDTAQVKALMTGVASLTIRTGNEVIEDVFSGNSFSEALARQYRALMAVAEL